MPEGGLSSRTHSGAAGASTRELKPSESANGLLIECQKYLCVTLDGIQEKKTCTERAHTALLRDQQYKITFKGKNAIQSVLEHSTAKQQKSGILTGSKTLGKNAAIVLLKNE